MVEGRAIRISGRVQGVGFRWWTSRLAKRLDLSGWVRNQEDGSVEVRAWGEPGRLAELERQLRRGPPGSRVDAIETSSVTDAAPQDDFRIAR